MRFREVLIGLFAMCIALNLYGDGGNISALDGLQMRNAKIPVYNAPEHTRDNRTLQMMVFFRFAERINELLRGDNVVLDIIAKDTDIDVIKNLWLEKPPYPLNAPFREVVNFWPKERNIYSEGVVFAPKCTIDTKNRYADDPGECYFRSQQLDVDGIGYKVDFARKTLTIHQNVNLVIRDEDCNPKELVPGTALGEYHFMTAKGDTMLIDLESAQGMLVGNVEMQEKRGTLKCDRLTIFYEVERRADGGRNLPGTANFFKHITRIYADGNVVISNIPEKGEKPKVSYAEHVEFIVNRDELILSGGENRPHLDNDTGEKIYADKIIINRTTHRMLADGNCHIVVEGDGGKRESFSRTGYFDYDNNRGELMGDVRVEDTEMTLFSDKLLIFLTDRKATDKDKDKGDKQLSSIESPGKVRILSKPQPGSEGKVSELTANRGIFNYFADKITFYDKVKIKDKTSTLDCDKLEIYLTARKNTATRTKIKGVSSTFFSGDNDGSKQLERAVATGHVHMVDPKAKIDSKILKLFFRELEKGQKMAQQGMFRAGSSRLVKIEADGDVVGVTNDDRAQEDKKDDPRFFNTKGGSRTLLAQHCVSNLLTNITEFHEKVQIFDDDGNRLNCRDMFLYMKPGAPKTAKKAADDPDADPFELPTESSVPSQLLIGPDMHLVTVVCENDVIMERVEEGGDKQRAGGDKCTYVVSDSHVFLTSKKPRRPWLSGSGMRQVSDQIVYDMKTGVFESVGDTVTFREDSIPKE